MVNFLKFRTNSDYDANSQIGRYHIRTTVPAGTYTGTFNWFYGEAMKTGDSDALFFDMTWKTSLDDEYYSARQCRGIYVGSEDAVIIAKCADIGDRFQTRVRLMVYQDELVLREDIRVDVWVTAYKMPF